LAKNLERNVPYPFEKVWDAALDILRQPNWDLVRADKVTGGLEVRIVMDLLTCTETFYMNMGQNRRKQYPSPHRQDRPLSAPRLGVSKPIH
jgi:hypothetical protein